VTDISHGRLACWEALNSCPPFLCDLRLGPRVDSFTNMDLVYNNSRNSVEH
jgi:hypothetical protein